VVVERERNMVLALAGMSSGVHPLSTTQAAMTLARRRAIGRWVMGALVVLLLVVGGIIVSRTVIPIAELSETKGVVNRTFRPSCLSLTAAADLLREQASSRTLQISMRLGSNVLWASGTPADLMRARSVLARYDNPAASTCVLPEPGTPKPESSGGLSGTLKE
jgi:hypothetical protein